MTYRYQGRNGYTGVMYGKSSLSVYDPQGREVLHTGRRASDEPKDLRNIVKGMPELLEMLRGRKIIKEVADHER